MARRGRLPRTAGRPPRFLRTGHRRATSLSEAHLQAARRDAGHTLGREAEGVLQSLLFHRASRGLRAQKATFRVLAERDADVDAALASAVGCSPPPRSLTPPRPPLSDQRARAARLRRCPDCPDPVRPRAGSQPRLRGSSARRTGARSKTCRTRAIKSRALGRLPLRRLEPEAATASRGPVRSCPSSSRLFHKPTALVLSDNGLASHRKRARQESS